MTEVFFFSSLDERRSRSELLHDLLIAAKDGARVTPLCRAVNYAWIPLMNLLKFAKAKGLINEIPLPKRMLRGRRGSATGWRTTERGLMYAQGVHANYQLLIQEVTA